MNELVTVIVPVYKVEKYLEKCLDSILGQSYRNLEIILVDDGSLDNCGQICDDYALKDPRIVVIHKANGGLSSARNAALDITKGDWILCVDSDDYIHPRMVEKMLSSTKAYSVDIVICSHYIEKENKLSITDRIIDDVVVMDRMQALDRLVEDKEIKSYAWGKLYRADLFSGVRYPEGRNYEDIATTYYLFDRAQKIIKIPEYLYFYLVRDDSISYNNSAGSWHKGCHASCLGQEERAEYFKKKGYAELYDKAMASLLPYLFSDIKSAYKVKAFEDARSARDYIGSYREYFWQNSYVSAKDKKLISVYMKGPGAFGVYETVKKPFSRIGKAFRKTKAHIRAARSDYDFSLQSGRSRRIIYFELPCFDNLGDHAIAYATGKLLNEICEKLDDTQVYIVSGWDTDMAVSSLKKVIGKRDVIVCQGGGNFGSLYEFAQVFRRKVLESFCDNKIVVMPQTVFYSEDESGKKELSLDQKAVERCKMLTILARDRKSLELFKQYFSADVRLMHDVVTTLDIPSFDVERRGILLCLRSDKESKLSTGDKHLIMEAAEALDSEVHVTDTCTYFDIDENEREEVLLAKLKLWSGTKLVVTDRLHGMIFSLITQTPCIVIGNNHHKVKETYETIKDCGYIYEAGTIEKIEKDIAAVLEKDGDKTIKRMYWPKDMAVYKELFGES
jgi:exopolysaccharide biosynthesis predicted pyruvyltransferase EpsI